MQVFEDLCWCTLAQPINYKFHRGFQAYLKGYPNYNLEMYKRLVGEITSAFSGQSKDILAIGQLMDESGKTEVAKIISCIQGHEQRKLQVVRLYKTWIYIT